MTNEDAAMPREKSGMKGWKGFVVLALAGGGVGYLVGMTAARAGLDIDTQTLSALGTSGVVALAIGAIYLLVGLALLASLIRPSIGHNLLTGVNAEDLADARPLYLMQGAAAALLGLALIALTVSGPGLWLDRTVGAVAFVALLVAGLVVWIRSMANMDELLQTANRDSVIWRYVLVATIGGGWAAASHLGFVDAPSPLDWISLFWGMALIGSTVAAARRGMLIEE